MALSHPQQSAPSLVSGVQYALIPPSDQLLSWVSKPSFFHMVASEPDTPIPVYRLGIDQVEILPFNKEHACR